jgi:hypothetical protein
LYIPSISSWFIIFAVKQISVSTILLLNIPMSTAISPKGLHVLMLY